MASDPPEDPEVVELPAEVVVPGDPCSTMLRSHSAGVVGSGVSCSSSTSSAEASGKAGLDMPLEMRQRVDQLG